MIDYEKWLTLENNTYNPDDIEKILKLDKKNLHTLRIGYMRIAITNIRC